MRKLALVLVVLTAASCAKRAPEAAAMKNGRVGEPVKLDDSTWIVVGAKDLGKQVEPNTSFAEAKETSGRFILVRFKVTNTRKKPESILEPPKLVDDQSRETDRFGSEALYVPPKSATLGIELLEPGIEKEYATLFDAPADAKGLKLQVRGLGLLGERRLVDLGL